MPVSAQVPKAARRIVNALPTIGFIVDDRGRVVTASRTAKASGVIAHRKAVDRGLRALIKRAGRGRKPIEEEVSVDSSRPGAQPLDLDVRAVSVGHGHVAVLAEDQSRHRRVEAVRRDFLANISHELKTPIAAVGLLAEALQAGADDPERVRQFSAQLVRESQRLARLSADVIELSRLETSTSPERMEPCGIDGVVHAAVAQAMVAAEAADVRLVIGADCGASVYGDERLLVMAVANLLSNAVRFSPAGQAVTVGADTDAETDIVRITVADRGPGIPADELSRVFERFYRTDQARARDDGGTGLGLAIVKHVADTHGGDVVVVSRPGQGATFTIRLPQADAQLTESAEEDDET